MQQSSSYCGPSVEWWNLLDSCVTAQLSADNNTERYIGQYFFFSLLLSKRFCDDEVQIWHFQWRVPQPGVVLLLL